MNEELNMNEDALSQLYLKDTAFQDLMQKHIFNVLLIASTCNRKKLSLNTLKLYGLILLKFL